MTVMKVSEHHLGIILQNAIDILLSGGIVAYPTETFYALGVKFDMQDTLQRLYDLKQRPSEKAMPLIIGDQALLSSLSTSINRTALSLIENFWPGPLTLIVPAFTNLSPYITADTHTVAVRIPGESFALKLAQAARFPITATSANISGKPPASDAESVAEYFNAMIDLIIDDGMTPGGSPSTIVDVTGKHAILLREGAVKKENMAAYFMPG
jgi:L-threonylcarbamoyladenylate synthase